VLATLTKAMFMKSKLKKLVLPFGLLLILGCGARSTLDMPDEEPTISTGGVGGILGSGGHGGSLGGGGSPSTGGIFGGGGLPGTGGIPNMGGSVGGFGGMGPGGSPMGGSKGGAGGVGLGGQVGGSRGGAGGIGLGGQVGGSRGGAGGSFATGGRIGAGGSAGGAAGTIGPDGGFGGSGGVIGRDGGPDVRPDGAGGKADSGVGDAMGTDGNTCQGLASNEELIDDLNDGDRFIPSLNGRVGAWSDSHDSSPNAKMYPDPNTGFAPTDTGDPCRKYAVYVAGGGYVLWGADFWFGLGSPYDASKYKGITFWAKIDSGASPSLRVAFPDKDTQPDGNMCETGISSGPTACYDHYGYRITLDSTWTKHTVLFSQLGQEGWGHAGTAFDPTSLYEVLFQISVGANFGFWIDDVAFIM
jgi:hypothetical protein